MFAFATLEGSDVQNKALKLHRQFGHPTSEKLNKLISDAGVKDSGLRKAVETVSRDCKVCCKFKKARPRPIVCMPMASKFNDVISMDLKVWGNCYFLVIVDLATRYCTATVIRDKCANTIIKALFLKWIVTFGAPRKILTDNGCEFNNSEMRTLGEAFNVKIMTTSAESPWSNGVCERLNGVIGDMVRKIMADNGCDLEVALAWAVSARNALTNYLGFAPNQLVFGNNPSLPNVSTNALPALEPVVSSEIVRNHLNALHSARQGFIKAESSERLARALRHNIRSSDHEELVNGAEVYYKRNDSNEWRGPGIIIGRDGKQFLVKHGGGYVRVHECRLTCAPESWSESRRDEDDHGGAARVEDQTLPSRYTFEEESEDGDVHGNATEIQVGEVSESTTEVESAPEIAPALPSRLVAGTRIQGTRSDTGELVSGRVMSRAGKASGRYSDCYNFRWDSDGSISWADLKKDFSTWKIVDDDTELLVLFNTEEVLRAKEKEITNWRDNEVYEEVEDVGQGALSVRWVVTEKVKDGQTVVKARLVARGFEEETGNLRKDSPTCSKEAVRLALSVAATCGWVCHSLDVKAAYLQGDQIDRDVYLRPPPEFNDGSLWKLKKTVYGLCDAARHWYLRVRSQLLDLGTIASSLDPALFSWRCGQSLEGVICVYVDDLFWAGTNGFKEQVIDRLCQIFRMGNSESKAFKYVGLNIVSYGDGSVTLDQNQYAATLTPISVSKQKATVKSSELSESERSEYRALLGQLNWIATHTRPDIAFEVCELSGACSKATIADLLRLNKVIDRVKNDGIKLYMPRMEKLENCFVECFSDASFANLAGSGSQGGFVVFLRDDSGKRCPIYWQSKKIRRVVKSTLSAETLALLDCAEAAVYLVRILDDISDCGSLRVKCYVDNKSLVDALQSYRGVEDRRLRIDIAVLRDMLERREIGEVDWVDASKQLADCLTKRGASTDRLRDAVGRY